MLDGNLREYILDLMAQDKLYKFYKSKDWLELRERVLRDNHYECALCLLCGRYSRAVMVHHVNEVKKRPDMALTYIYTDAATGESRTNLLPLCFSCHESVHDRFEEVRAAQGKARFTNQERW